MLYGKFTFVTGQEHKAAECRYKKMSRSRCRKIKGTVCDIFIKLKLLNSKMQPSHLYCRSVGTISQTSLTALRLGMQSKRNSTLVKLIEKHKAQSKCSGRCLGLLCQISCVLFY